MRTEPPAPASPARTASDRLHVLVCQAGAAGDLPTLKEVVAHALESLGTVLGAGRGAIALAGSNGALTVAGSRGLSLESLAAIEALPADAPDPAALLAALATDGVKEVAVLPLLPDAAPRGAGGGDAAPQGAVSEEAVVGLMV